MSESTIKGSGVGGRRSKRSNPTTNVEDEGKCNDLNLFLVYIYSIDILFSYQVCTDNDMQLESVLEM